MTIAERVYKKTQHLPESTQLEVLRYIDHLAERVSQENSAETQQKAQAWFKKMSQKQHVYSDIDPIAWQNAQRTDKPLPFRD